MNLIDELEREKTHADNMAAAAQMWMHKAQEYERVIAALVHATGGRITVGLETMHIIPELELIKFEDPDKFAVVFETRNPSNIPSNR